MIFSRRLSYPHDVLHPTPRSALYAFAIPLHVEPGLHVNRDKNGVILNRMPLAAFIKSRRQPASDDLGAISTKTDRIASVNFILVLQRKYTSPTDQFT